MTRPPDRHAVLAPALEDIRRVDLAQVEDVVDRDLDWRLSERTDSQVDGLKLPTVSSVSGERQRQTSRSSRARPPYSGIAGRLETWPQGPRVPTASLGRAQVARSARSRCGRAAKVNWRIESRASTRASVGFSECSRAVRESARTRRRRSVTCGSSYRRVVSCAPRDTPARRPAPTLTASDRRRRAGDRARSRDALRLSARLDRLEHSARWSTGEARRSGCVRCR